MKINYRSTGVLTNGGSICSEYLTLRLSLSILFTVGRNGRLSPLGTFPGDVVCECWYDVGMPECSRCSLQDWVSGEFCGIHTSGLFTRQPQHTTRMMFHHCNTITAKELALPSSAPEVAESITFCENEKTSFPWPKSFYLGVDKHKNGVCHIWISATETSIVVLKGYDAQLLRQYKNRFQWETSRTSRLAFSSQI